MIKAKIEPTIAITTPILIELDGKSGVKPTAFTLYEFTGYEEIELVACRFELIVL